jgi:hypothetical protein
LDALLNMHAVGKLTTQLYDKRDNFNKCSNIPLSPAYGVYISQLIW